MGKNHEKLELKHDKRVERQLGKRLAKVHQIEAQQRAGEITNQQRLQMLSDLTGEEFIHHDYGQPPKEPGIRVVKAEDLELAPDFDDF
jgi:hypothetical protein